MFQNGCDVQVGYLFEFRLVLISHIILREWRYLNLGDDPGNILDFRQVWLGQHFLFVYFQKGLLFVVVKDLLFEWSLF